VKATVNARDQTCILLMTTATRSQAVDRIADRTASQ